MKIDKKTIDAFQKKILQWYTKHKRNLPWREIPKNISLDQRAYWILVSEVMSQQTQITRVVSKYEAWINQFPTIDVLAKAPIAEVLLYWSGLGYNRRALHLKKAAEMIVNKFGGQFPEDEKTLRSLPGIGEYTSRALLCFAFGKQRAVVDTNVRKVILTQLVKKAGVKNQESKRKEKSHDSRQPTLSAQQIERIAQALLPAKRASEWNQALMDYSAAVLKKEKIPVPKQSKFVGSHRYYRGQILKILLQQKKVSVTLLGQLIKKDYTSENEKWLRALITELKNEGFLIQKDDTIQLAT